jgi:hypothetical protein
MRVWMRHRLSAPPLAREAPREEKMSYRRLHAALAEAIEIYFWKRRNYPTCRSEGSAVGLQLRVRPCLLRCWLCYGLHWLSSAFLKPETGQAMQTADLPSLCYSPPLLAFV